MQQHNRQDTVAASDNVDSWCQQSLNSGRFHTVQRWQLPYL